MITYPLNIPGPGGAGPGIVFPGTDILVPSTPGPAKANLKKFDPIAEVIGPFDGSAQQQQYQNNWWELDLEWPEMTWAQFAPLDAFAGALKGKLGSFVWGPPLATGPQGMGLLAGVPVATGADAAGSNQLHTSAWLPTQSGILLPGDFLGIPPNALVIAELQSTLISGIYYIAIAGNGVVPPWLTFGANVWLAGTGLVDGGPYQVITSPIVVGSVGWNITLQSASALAQGTSTTGTMGEAPGASAVFPRLYQYVNPLPLFSDGGGNATLDIFPNLREAPIPGTPLVLINPTGTFRLAENRREAAAMKTKTFNFAMKCREAI
jgi:hypothetical protein